MAVGVAGFDAGAIASVAGFGIGSTLTRLLSLNLGMRMAVMAVSVPRPIATLFRFYLGRCHMAGAPSGPSWSNPR